VAVVDEIASSASPREGVSQVRSVAGPFSQQHQGRRVEEVIEIVERGQQGSRSTEDTRVGDHAQELVDTGPRDRPRTIPFRQLRHEALGVGVMR
jgi:hypothetical protein